LIPGGGALERLPLLVGRARALEVIAGSDDYDASTAERYGLINRAIPDAEFESWVDAFARRLASFDKQALASVKELVNRHTIPDPQDQLASGKVFLSAFGWPGFRETTAKLVANGLGQRGEFELNMGERLGRL
jgi:enoyl-CoA hydratase/carnithine racemase